jgi:hypothetical protein
VRKDLPGTDCESLTHVLAGLALRCFCCLQQGYQPPVQCWLAMCRKRKMIFTSSRSQLSITTPHPPGSHPTVLYCKTLGTRHRCAQRPEFCGRLTNSNLQAGVQGRAFARHVSFQSKHARSFLERRLTIFGACGKENSFRTAKSFFCILISIGGKSPSLPPARRSLLPPLFILVFNVAGMRLFPGSPT